MKKKCLIVMGYMSYGGIQKSLIDFLDAIKDKVDVDLLLWGRTQDEMPLPSWVNVIKVPTVKSVRASLREDGLFSRSFILSCLGTLRKKRWQVMGKLKKHYDVAIAYPQVGFPKYYVIDRVSADKKYAFYHHGAYEFSGKIKEWDKEYYQKYDKLFCVSKHVQSILDKEFNVSINYDVLPCGINMDAILEKGKEPCQAFDNASGIKILTVARLSTEKNLEMGLEIAHRLVEDNVEFTWLILGEGDLRSSLEQKIAENNLCDKVFLLGNQSNPYKFMKNCDVYAQFSKFEADPITVKETAIFSKPMVLSNITAFQNTQNAVNNVTLCDTVEQAVTEIENISNKQIFQNDLSKINEMFLEKVEEIFKYEPMSEG
ncbi:MAG: glycosyltransferase [Clostridiales bacterium]|nr:glycosyltransferase [Clostridiales bacterium]